MTMELRQAGKWVLRTKLGGIPAAPDSVFIRSRKSYADHDCMFVGPGKAPGCVQSDGAAVAPGISADGVTG